MHRLTFPLTHPFHPAADAKANDQADQGEDQKIQNHTLQRIQKRRSGSFNSERKDRRKVAQNGLRENAAQKDYGKDRTKKQTGNQAEIQTRNIILLTLIPQDILSVDGFPATLH